MQYAVEDRRPLAIAAALVAAGLAVLVFALLNNHAVPAAPAAPAIAVQAPTPAPAPAAVSKPVAQPLAHIRPRWRQALERNESAHVSADWVAGLYPIYERAHGAWGVNWLLLASVHRQETAFSSHPSTYHGLNFARCCAGPMQFNVTNGPRTTWEHYRNAFRAPPRPASYPNRT